MTKVVGIESRGFIGGAVLARDLGAGFVPVRKPGKLPADTISKSYSKEYGVDTIEIHRDAIAEGDVVVLHDDLLATGGTMAAAYDLVKSMNPKKSTSALLSNSLTSTAARRSLRMFRWIR